MLQVVEATVYYWKFESIEERRGQADLSSVGVPYDCWGTSWETKRARGATMSQAGCYFWDVATLYLQGSNKCYCTGKCKFLIKLQSLYRMLEVVLKGRVLHKDRETKEFRLGLCLEMGGV